MKLITAVALLLAAVPVAPAPAPGPFVGGSPAVARAVSAPATPAPSPAPLPVTPPSITLTPDEGTVPVGRNIRVTATIANPPPNVVSINYIWWIDPDPDDLDVYPDRTRVTFGSGPAAGSFKIRTIASVVSQDPATKAVAQSFLDDAARVTVTGPTPPPPVPPGPQPDPTPQPQPSPVPTPAPPPGPPPVPMTTHLNAVAVYSADPSDAAERAFAPLARATATIHKALKDGLNVEWRAWHTSNAELDALNLRPHLGGITPALLIYDDKGTLYYNGSAPVTEADVTALIKKIRGMP